MTFTLFKKRIVRNCNVNVKKIVRLLLQAVFIIG